MSFAMLLTGVARLRPIPPGAAPLLAKADFGLNTTVERDR
jgi:hypothetical protein